MKKKILGFTLVLFAALVLVACKPKADNAQLVADAKEALTVQATATADFKVAAVDGDVAITWVSKDTRVLAVGATANGETTITVSRLSADTDVVLEATLTLGEESDTKEFTVKVTGTGEVVTEVTVTFTVTFPAETPAGDIYIVGDLKHADTATWDTGAASGKMTRTGNTATFTLVYDADDLPASIEYKYTMGSWDLEELQADGTAPGNRKATITAAGSTMAINDTVAQFKAADPDPDPDPDPDREYANGSYNFRFADSDLRHTFFAAAEGYLLDNVAGGVPLFANSGASLYAPRVQLPVEKYVPVMGWGSSFGTLNADDSTVTFSAGKTGEAGKHTYRGAFTSNPTTFNQWISDDSVSSDAQAFMFDSLYHFVFNEAKDGYAIEPSLANAMPTPTDPETQGDYEVATKWSVPVREGLEWKFHPGTTTTGLETTIDAQDFVDTFRFALENGWFRAIAGGGHFWASSNNVVGAQAFRTFVNETPAATKAELDAEWEKVGIKVDGNNIEFEFMSDLSEWNVIYWLSSNVMSPVHLGLLEQVGINNYAQTPEQMAYTGPYYLDNYEADRVLEFKANENHHFTNAEGVNSLYNYDGYYFVIIERSEIVFAEFEAGNLDAAGLPLTKFEQYKNDPGLKRSPGPTTFRMNINGLGTVANQKEQFPSGAGNTWVPEPLLSNLNMKKALYWAVDRETLAWDILKTSDPMQFYFSDAYLVDPQTGTAFRQTDQGKALGTGLSTNTYGYNLENAQSFFDTAVAELVAAGQLNLGTAAEPTVIELDLSIQAASTSQAQLAEFLKSSFEGAFNNRPASPHLSLDITIDPVAFPDNYYARSIPGRFDLATGGISGSTLDASSFLEVFTSDNRGGFTLDWGFDTSVANIPVSYTLDGEDIVDEYWSFDAIVSVLNGPITVENGREASNTAAIEALETLIASLPAVEDYVHATHAADVLKAYNNFWSLLPKDQAEISADDYKKMDELSKARTAAINTGLVTEVQELIADLDNDSEDEDINKALAELQALSAANYGRIKLSDLAKVARILAPQVNAALAAIPAEVTLAAADLKLVADAADLYATLVDLVGETGSFLLVDAADVTTLDNAQSRIQVLEALAAIAALPAVEDVVLTSQYAINDARALFDALSTTQLATIPNAEELETELKALEAAVKVLIDLEEAFLWTLSVAALPDANDIVSTHRVQVEIVINGFNALSDEAKVLKTDKFDVPASVLTLQEIIEVLEETIDDLVELEFPEEDTEE